MEAGRKSEAALTSAANGLESSPSKRRSAGRAAEFSGFDAVKATQYGATDRVRQLVLDLGHDVNQRDADDVTLLHWAAINNRLEIADFLLSQGAGVNTVGGELRSCPLHWAVRQGHLPMVVKLIRHGADPAVQDGEGGNGLHLAAQLGHTAIAAYLAAKGCPVNGPDATGMTPLMWSCLKSTSHVDPTQLLLTLGASVNVADDVHRNTPLHWAILSKNHYALGLLIDRPGVHFTQANLQGDSPLNLYHKMSSQHSTTPMPRKIGDTFQRYGA